MKNSKIVGLGYHVPEKVVTNEDLSKLMDTNDEWIQTRTGIKERRHAVRGQDTTGTLGAKASRKAIADAGLVPDDIDFIICATLSSDYYFPGAGVIIQRELGITKSEIGAIDIRNQCTGFIYALSVGDQFIKTGMYKNILVVGAEMQSMGLEMATRGRGVSVIFGDGAGAVILQPTEEKTGVLSTKLHADGTYAEKLAMLNPGSHGGYHLDKMGLGDLDHGFSDDVESTGDFFVTQGMLDNGMMYPRMEGKFVFKLAVQKFPEVIYEVLEDAEMKNDAIDLLVPHQANLRISQFVQKKMGLKDDQIWNNIQRFGNTTAASIPIALAEAYEAGKISKGDGSIVVLAAFGSGFTWGGALIKF